MEFERLRRELEAPRPAQKVFMPVVATAPAPVEQVKQEQLFAPVPELSPDDYPARTTDSVERATWNGQVSGMRTSLEPEQSKTVEWGTFQPRTDSDSPAVALPKTSHSQQGIASDKMRGQGGKDDRGGAVDTFSVRHCLPLCSVCFCCSAAETVHIRIAFVIILAESFVL